MALMHLLVVAAVISCVIPMVWADTLEEGMELTAITSEESPTVSIMGKTVRADPVQFVIISPSRNIVQVDQVEPDGNGAFGTEFNVSGLVEDGLYTITANQGQANLYQLRIQVAVHDGSVSNGIVTQSNFEKATSTIGLEVTIPDGISLVADAMEGSDMIHISGQTDSPGHGITLTVRAPNGNVISVQQVNAAMPHGAFEHDIMIGGHLWSQDGEYTVTANQDIAGYEATVAVDVADGLVVPEFGSVAALILAVSIVSIVAVSARSRLAL